MIAGFVDGFLRGFLGVFIIAGILWAFMELGRAFGRWLDERFKP